MTGTAEIKLYQESTHEAVAQLLQRKRSLVGLWVVAGASDDDHDGKWVAGEVIDVLDADGSSLAVIRYPATGLMQLADISGLFEIGLGLYHTADEAKAAIAAAGDSAEDATTVEAGAA